MEKHFIVNSIHRWLLTGFLRFDLAASRSLVDLVAFWPTDLIGLDYHMSCVAIVEELRSLPENCCMSDGRKWKKIPCVILSESPMFGYNRVTSAGEVRVVLYSQHDGYIPFRMTVQALQQVVERYQARVLEDYVKVGILVNYEHGRYRVRWALQRRDPNAQTDYYYASRDTRRLARFVTVHRDAAGVEYEAKLFEQMINSPETIERDLQRFFEQHPAFLMDCMQGVPVAHRPRFASRKGWAPDFSVSPALPNPTSARSIQLLELKGVNVPLLSGRLHRGFSADVMAAINQVRDYDRVLRENHASDVRSIAGVFGYMPKTVRRAVVIGRSPRGVSDIEALRQRGSEQPDVQIVPYDEILQTQRQQLEVV
jgi:Domain of unknown function (DUF4263)